MKKFGFLTVALLAASLLVPSAVSATTSTNFVLPDFSSCNAPAGTLVVSYATGSHWIVGNNVLQEGSDSVYSLGTPNYLQCYCPVEGTAGIETDWYGIGDVDSDTITSLKAQGWLSVDHGTDFGLQDMPYLALNKSFDCSAVGGNTGSPSPSPTSTPTESPTPTPSASPTESPTPTPSPSSTNTGSSSGGGSNGGSSNSSASSSAPAVGGAEVAAAAPSTGSILGASTLAFTGNDHTKAVDAIIALGTVMLTAGVVFYAKSKKHL